MFIVTKTAEKRFNRLHFYFADNSWGNSSFIFHEGTAEIVLELLIVALGYYANFFCSFIRHGFEEMIFLVIIVAPFSAFRDIGAFNFQTYQT